MRLIVQSSWYALPLVPQPAPAPDLAVINALAEDGVGQVAEFNDGFGDAQALDFRRIEQAVAAV